MVVERKVAGLGCDCAASRNKKGQPRCVQRFGDCHVILIHACLRLPRSGWLPILFSFRWSPRSCQTSLSASISAKAKERDIGEIMPSFDLGHNPQLGEHSGDTRTMNSK